MLVKEAAAALMLAAGIALPAAVRAQTEIRSDETLSSTRPEAWAMNYVTASTYLTSFGETPALAPWRWELAAELGHIPRLSAEQQRVGFTGSKQEELNKSPVFGRLRLLLGLPAGFVGEVAYTPPLEIRGVQPKNLFGLALGRGLYRDDRWSVSARVFGQWGSAEGDITCPAHLAGAGIEENPYGCQEPSNDRIDMDYYGADATVAWKVHGWRLHASAGTVRTQLAVQVDALTMNLHDRSYLTADATKAFFTLGAACDLDARWSLAAEVLHVPLKVQRQIDGSTERDPFTGLRVQLRYRLD